EEMCYRHAENLGDALQAPGRNAVRAFLVFLHLLERDADEIAELGLRQAALQAQRTHTLADLGVAGISASSCHEGHQSRNGIRPWGKRPVRRQNRCAETQTLRTANVRTEFAQAYEL